MCIRGKKINYLMQKIPLNKKALTLTELIVSTVLIGIIMTGVATFTFAIKTIQDSSSYSTILNTRTASVMSHLVSSANLAVGWAQNPGISLDGWNSPFSSGTIPNDPQWVAFRHDTDNTPTNYNGDTWYIYICHLPGDSTAGADYTLRYCTMSAAQFTAAGDAPDEVGACSPANSLILSTNLGVLICNLHLDDLTYQKFTLRLGIRTEWLPGSGNTNPLENPYYNLITSVTPMGHTW